jgi:antirestriction protein ArdC
VKGGEVVGYKKTKKRRDLYKETTDAIVAAIEEAIEKGEPLPWQKSWTGADGGVMPVSGATGKRYKGVNVLRLWAAGYGDSRWYTYKGAQKAGGNVRKGEKSTPIVYFSFIEKKDEKTGKEEKIPILRAFAGFNREQCEWEQEEAKPPAEPVAVERADNLELLLATGIEVRHGGGRACYNHVNDFIKMPKLESFKTQDDYWAVMWHEVTHATGHPLRLDRTFGKRFGDNAYAFEELVAELGAAFICAELGVTPSAGGRDDHAAYIQGWLKTLKNDKRAIFTAAKKATEAAEWVIEQSNNAEQTVELAAAAK